MEFLNNLIGNWESLLLGAVAFFAAWYVLPRVTNLRTDKFPLYGYSAAIAIGLVILARQFLPGIFGNNEDNAAMV